MNNESQKVWLSDAALREIEDESSRGFFQRAIRSVGIGKRKVLQAPLEGLDRWELAEQAGFFEYARISGLSIWVGGLDGECPAQFAVFDLKVSGSRVLVSSESGNVIFDKVPIFALDCGARERVILFFHIRAFVDDGTIDDDERMVLTALRCLFGFSGSDVMDVLFNLYRSLLIAVLRDGVVEDHEIEVLRRIQDQMGLGAKGTSKNTIQIANAIAEELMECEFVSDAVLDKVTEALLRVGVEFTDSMLEKLRTKVWMSAVMAYGPAAIETDFNTGNAIPYLSIPTNISKQMRVKHVHRTSVGTRVNMGKTPVYLGRSSPQIEFREQMVPVGKAQFIVTDRKVLVVGAQSFSLSFEKILKMKIYKEGLFINYDGRYNAYLYEMSKDRAIKVFFLIDYMMGSYGDFVVEPTDEVSLFSADIENTEFINPYAVSFDESTPTPALNAPDDIEEEDGAPTEEVPLEPRVFRETVIGSLPDDYLVWCLDDLEIPCDDLTREEMERLLFEREDTDAAWIISDLKKQELASLCAALNVPSQGTKAALRQRIEDLEQALAAQAD